MAAETLTESLQQQWPAGIKQARKTYLAEQRDARSANYSCAVLTAARLFHL